MASTSSSPTTTEEPKENWDVFICFRGSDVRDKFLDDLEDELKVTRKIKVFVDRNLPTGDDISNLFKKIENSYIAIVIFSKAFADSSFCLNEVVKIRECRKATKKIIAIPVFYEVDPGHVQDLQERYESKRLRSEQSEKKDDPRPFESNFLNLLKKEDGEEGKIKDWLEALTEISNIKGYDGQKRLESKNKTDYQLIKEIAKDVSNKLCERLLPGSDNDNFVKINSHVVHVEEVKSLLDINSKTDARTIGICGLRGVGKTTIAEKVYNDIKHTFDGYDFIEDVKEKIKKQTPRAIRDDMISKLLKVGGHGWDIGTPAQVNPEIGARLKDYRVLILFDDVEDWDDLKRLGGESALYGEGSRIIVTSNDLQVLKKVCSDENYIFEVKPLPDADALELFCSNAFKQSVPKDEFVKESNEVISYAQGLPLALCVLGSNLFGRDDMDYWTSLLEHLKKIPDKKITNVLRTSYDGLARNEKRMFLDIACLLKGERRSRVVRIFEGCGFGPKIGMNRLIEKSLMSISPTNRVQMHDLIQQMGQEIVQEESQERPGEGSRLWKYEEAYDVLENDMGTVKVEGISIQSSKANGEGKIELSRTAFKKLSNLRIFKDQCGLVDRNVNVPDDLDYLPQKLRYLYWSRFPLKYLPLDPKNLVELCLPRSSLTTLWDENKRLDKLRCMELESSFMLTSIPSLANVPNLEILNLEYCCSLDEIPISPKTSSKLKILNCNYCDRLKIPKDFDSLTSLEELYLCKNKLERLPATIIRCSELEFLQLGSCEKLECLPELPESLKYLIVAYCMKLACLPELPKSLKYLDASGCTSLTSASSSFISSEVQRGSCRVNFAYCIKLEENVCRKIVEDVFARHLLKQRVYLCIKGSQMLESMMHKNCGSSTLSIPLDQEHALVGLSLCAVLSAKNHEAFFHLPSINCEAIFKVESGQSFKFVFNWREPMYLHDLSMLKLSSEKISHILNWYEPFNGEMRFVEASFHFYLDSSDITHAGGDSWGCSDAPNDGIWPIVGCGVHPTYN